jgi:hypothetical protein
MPRRVASFNLDLSLKAYAPRFLVMYTDHYSPPPCQYAPLLRISSRHMLIVIHQGSSHDAGFRAQQVDY